jgi:hypothetical protein
MVANSFTRYRCLRIEILRWQIPRHKLDKT